jgi:hypothetical protein
VQNNIFCHRRRKKWQKTCEFDEFVVILHPLFVAPCPKAYVSSKKIKEKEK